MSVEFVFVLFCFVFPGGGTATSFGKRPLFHFLSFWWRLLMIMPASLPHHGSIDWAKDFGRSSSKADLWTGRGRSFSLLCVTDEAV